MYRIGFIYLASVVLLCLVVKMGLVIPVWPSLMCFLTGAISKGLFPQVFVCLMFVYVFCAFVSGLIWLFLDNLWLDDLCAG